MKVSNSQHRIAELLNYLQISQTEFCNKTGIQKSALSNYLNGDREPRQPQLAKIADAFGVDPAWLMGYEVPMFRILNTKPNFTDAEIQIIRDFRDADEVTQQSILRLLEYARKMQGDQNDN